jgi:hypothetical protein
MDDVAALKQFISELPEEDQKKVERCVTAFRLILEFNPEYGPIALALVGAEMAAEE